MSHVVSIDNRLGFAASVGNGATGYVVGNEDIIFSDITLYGESEIPDCPPKGGYCFRPKKGAFLSAVSAGAKPLMILKPSALPPEKVGGNAVWSTDIKLNRVTFINFKKLTREGMPNKAFTLMPSGSDMIPIQKFYDTRFVNCDEDAFGFFFEPP